MPGGAPITDMQPYHDRLTIGHGPQHPSLSTSIPRISIHVQGGRKERKRERGERGKEEGGREEEEEETYGMFFSSQQLSCVNLQ